MDLKAVLFDVDGTLSHTEDAHMAAFNEAFRAEGLVWRWNRDLYGRLLSVAGGRERIRHYIDTENLNIGLRGQKKDDWIARLHADKSGVEVEYLQVLAEDIAEQRAGEYDAVTCLEMLEHVPDPSSVIRACAKLVKPGGQVFFSTINRNPKSFAMAILGAEWVMRWLPRGTHEWSKFITPDELFDLLHKAGLTAVDRKGFVFNPITWSWRLSDRDLSVNYVTASLKPE